MHHRDAPSSGSTANLFLFLRGEGKFFEPILLLLLPRADRESREETRPTVPRDR